MTDEASEIEAVVAEIRAEAARLRAGLAASPVPRADEGRAVGDPATVDRLIGLADPAAVELRSHRRRLGRAAVAVKATLRRLLTPVLERQARFNRGLAGWLGEIEEDLDERVASLQARLAELERAAPGAEGDERVPWLDAEELEAELRGEHPAEGRRRYLAYFSEPGAGPVLELGCRRGAFLAMLRDHGVAAWGVEQEPALVAEARACGLDARPGDPLDALAALEPGSLGGLVAFRYLDRLPLGKTLRLLRLARERLRPGGRLVLEGYNVSSLIVHIRGLALDPALVRPLHPLTLHFLVGEAGFAEPELVFRGEVEPGTALEGAGEGDPAARNAARLNALLFAPQDYAVVARA